MIEDLYVGNHRSAFLGQAGLVQGANVAPRNCRGCGQRLSDSDNTGSTDAGDSGGVRHGGQRRRAGEISRLEFPQCHFCGARAARHYCHEGRAISFEAGEVEIARRLVDPRFPAELGLDRLNRQAIRLSAAVPTALTHPLVDHDALNGLNYCAALALTTQLGSALLIVDDDRDTRCGSQRLLSLAQTIAMPATHTTR